MIGRCEYNARMLKYINWPGLSALGLLAIIVGFFIPATVGNTQTLIAQTVAVAQQQEPGKLLAAGDGNNIWLLSPVWTDSAQTQAGFVLLNHQTNVLAGNYSLWTQVANIPSIGIPADAVAESEFDPQYDGGLLAIFPQGVLTRYSLNQDNTLSQYTLKSLPFHIQPYAGTSSANGFYVLGYGTMKVPVKGATLSPAAATTHQAVLKAAGESVFTGFAIQSSSPLQSLPPAWWVFNYVSGNWQAQPGPDMPPPDIDHPANIQMAWLNGRLWVFWFDQNDPTTINVSSANISADQEDKTIQWTQAVPLFLHTAPEAFSIVANDENLFLLWYSTSGKIGDAIGGAEVDVEDSTPRLSFWGDDLLKFPAVTGASENITAARDGDCIAVFIRAADSKLYEATLDDSGKVIANLHELEPSVTPEPNSEDFEELFFFGLIFLLALFLWQRRQPFIAPAPGLVVARLYQRLGAAVIDISIGAMITAIIFGIYTQQQWTLLGLQALDLLQAHQYLQADIQAICVLGIYELHVTIGECFFGRSVGKWMFSLRVVALDGSRAKVIQVLVRNLVRIPEILVYVLLVFVLVSAERQRLGDLLSRTLVVRDGKIPPEDQQ
ncbi:MAG TPA: RDD family protein [Phycisphaerae bacterium]|nr:RDD family protein [Phycisphaerae bacterium]